MIRGASGLGGEAVSSRVRWPRVSLRCPPQGKVLVRRAFAAGLGKFGPLVAGQLAVVLLEGRCDLCGSESFGILRGWHRMPFARRA